MKFLTITFAFLTLTLPLAQGLTYKITEDYSPEKFFKGFNYYDGSDPTHGFVTYVDKKTAKDKKYVQRTKTNVYIGVDYKTELDEKGKGRESVRLESKRNYNKGLFILDVEHMPGGICGTWPAFWTLGDGEWPGNGEIDIVEGVHMNNQNMMALHTSDDCTVDGKDQTAKLETPNCFVNAKGQANNQGCSMKDQPPLPSFGKAFNDNKGGIFAMEWTSKHIKIWFFPRDKIPENVRSQDPDPSKWGTPNAKFAGKCDIDKKFKNHRIIFNTTFCGDWAGGVWGNAQAAPGCGKSDKGETCNAFVAKNPAEFRDAYWLINGLKVFQLCD